MIMKKIIILALFLSSQQLSFAEELIPLHTRDNQSSLDISFASFFQNAGAIALSWQRISQIQFIKSERFFVGYGFRFTSNGSQNKPFVTAPGKVSEGNFFKKQNENKLDTLYLQKSNTNSINLAIYLGFEISHKLFLELEYLINISR